MSKTKATPALPLPGEKSREEKIKRMMRVDQAGEYGAVRIYKGQLDVFGEKHPLYPMIKHMAAQEDEHLATFNSLMGERGVRPTALQPFWHVAGYALGAATALMGEKAAMACTAAVEEVIDDHYEEQRQKLRHWGVEDKFEKTIAKFQAEEVEHKELAIENGAEQTPGYELLSGVIKAGCKAAIFLAKRV